MVLDDLRIVIAMSNVYNSRLSVFNAGLFPYASDRSGNTVKSKLRVNRFVVSYQICSYVHHPCIYMTII